MRNRLLIIFSTCTLSACSPDRRGAQNASFGDYMVSDWALICYGVIIGIVIGLLWPRIRGVKSGRAEYLKAKGVRTQIHKQDRLPSASQVDKTLEQKVFQLEDELKKCRHEKDELQRALAEAEQFSRIANQQKDKPDKAKYGMEMNTEEQDLQEVTTLYYLQPSAEGRFKEMSKVNTAAEALYELSYLNSNPSIATLKFIDSPGNAFLAVQNEPTWILVACERSNIPSENTQSIRTDISGEAVLKNGEWEVVQKAKITYV